MNGMSDHDRQTPAGDVTAQLVHLLPELAVALYESAPHHHGEMRPATAEPLTGRQMEAVVFLSHRPGVTMGEFADGLEISRAAASELVARLTEKDVVRRETDADDRRVVYVRLAGAAEQYAGQVFDAWRRDLEAVFARFPDIDPDTLVDFLGALIDQLKGHGDT
jgi:DNA-binding MarR family transcriptional regulator